MWLWPNIDRLGVLRYQPAEKGAVSLCSPCLHRSRGSLTLGLGVFSTVCFGLRLSFALRDSGHRRCKVVGDRRRETIGDRRCAAHRSSVSGLRMIAKPFPHIPQGADMVKSATSSPMGWAVVGSMTDSSTSEGSGSSLQGSPGSGRAAVVGSLGKFTHGSHTSPIPSPSSSA